MVKVIVLRTAGTNCDYETSFAFQSAGAEPELVHINRLAEKKKILDDYRILAIPGGFTYGDDIASGKILANELRLRLEDQLQRFVAAGKLVIGICNGFQVLVKAGFLPGLAGPGKEIEATLTRNDSGKFEDRWTYLKLAGGGRKCVWTGEIPETIYLPVAHGEGKFVPRDASMLKRLKTGGQVVLRYVDREGGSRAGYPANPNGSVDDVAGICDPGGRIFGLMPHPERHIHFLQHPRWTREGRKRKGDGAGIFHSAVGFARRHL